MIKIKFIILISIFFSFQRGFAQERLIYHILTNNGLEKDFPFLTDPFYEEITYGKTERNTNYYGLKGDVKSVSINGLNGLDKITFNRNQQVSFVRKNGINNETINDRDRTIEEYSYKNQRLLERKRTYLYYSDTTQTNYTYNEQGYLIEIEKHFRGKDSRKNEVFQYAYNENYTSVRYKYYSNTKVYRNLNVYEDFKEDTVNFYFDESGNYKYPNTMITYDSLSRPVHYFINNGCGRNSALCLDVSTVFDSKGNIIEQTVNDQTTRNALWSFSSSFKAGYDDNNLLIWKEGGISESNYYPISYDELLYEINNPVLVPREIYEYTFDTHGNWTTLKIYQGEKMNKLVEKKIEYYN